MWYLSTKTNKFDYYICACFKSIFIDTEPWKRTKITSSDRDIRVYPHHEGFKNKNGKKIRYSINPDYPGLWALIFSCDVNMFLQLRNFLVYFDCFFGIFTWQTGIHIIQYIQHRDFGPISAIIMRISDFVGRILEYNRFWFDAFSSEFWNLGFESLWFEVWE